MSLPFASRWPASWWWWRGVVLVLTVLLAGCATAPLPQPAPVAPLFDDALFRPPARVVPPESVFAMSPAMLQFAEQRLAPLRHESDPRQAMIEVMYQANGLRLSYDATRTRTAAEAFEAREGNCLSLVIMTATFARWMNLAVNFQIVVTDETYTRNGKLTLASQHVNLEFMPPALRRGTGRLVADNLVVDFLPSVDLRGQVVRTIEQQTIMAMYFNNRAAEAMAAGDTDGAYWLAREALRQDPGYASAANTLGVIYLRAGHAAQAEAALRHALAHDDRSVSALANLLPLLQGQQRHAEAAEVSARLARLQPVQPFKSLDEGRLAMAAGNYQQARELFQQELRLQPYQDEVHFWAAQAAWRLGRSDEAMRHLAQARDYSLDRRSQARYSAKLEGLRAVK